jgi:hypothetical protein
MLKVQVRICGIRDVPGRTELTLCPFWNEGSMKGARGKSGGYDPVDQLYTGLYPVGEVTLLPLVNP